VLKMENAEKALVCTHGGVKKILRICNHGALAWELCNLGLIMLCLSVVTQPSVLELNATPKWGRTLCVLLSFG
jgi:hypothetical protein